MYPFQRIAIGTLFVCGLAASAQAGVIITVPGTANPWLAGMPDGSVAAFGDVAPAESPSQVTGLAFGPGSLLTFLAVGATDHCSLGGCGLAGAEGDLVEGVTGHATGVENGISNVFSPIDALIGVFLGPGAPNVTPMANGLDFSTLASRDFASLSPLLQQTFFIGNGLRNDGLTAQTFLVPTGATRLFLGVMDGVGWFNNVGELRVTVDTAVTAVPEPATLTLLGLGLSGIAFGARRRRPKTS